MGSVSENQGSITFLLLLTIAISAFFLPSVGASAFTATPGSFTLSNTIIDVGQISVANTVISGGSGGPYSGQWSEFNANQINNQVINTITVGYEPESVAFNPSGTLAYVPNYGSNTVNVINTATTTVINTITMGADPYAVAFNHSGTLAYVANYGSGSASSTVSVINVATNTVINTITVGSEPDSVAINPSGTLVYVTNSNSGTTSVINTATNTVINTITVGAEPESVAFNPSGTLAYVANYGSSNPSNVSVIGNLPETSLQELPQTTNALSLTINAQNSNTLSLTFNGVAYTESTGSNHIYGTWSIYGFAQDNGTKIYYYGSNALLLSNSLTINPALTVGSVTPALLTTDGGQSVTLTGTWSGGTSPYTVKWYTGPAGNTCAEDSTNILATHSGLSLTSNSISVTPTTTNSYCIGVTDSASTPVTQLSANDVVTVNPALSVPTISPSNPTINSGQSVTFTASWTGGTSIYGSSLYSSTTPSTCNQQSTLVQQVTGISTTSVTFSPVTPNSNTYYCVFTTDNIVNFYSISNAIISGISAPSGVSISPSGTLAYVANEGSDNVVIINTATNSVTASITSGFSDIQGVSISPSGTYAYVTNCNITCAFANIPDNVVIINTATNSVTASITSGFNIPYPISFSPSGTYAYVANQGSDNVVIINTATNSVTGSITSGFSNPAGVAFSPSGTYAYVTNLNTNNVVIINTVTNSVIGSITSGFNGPEEVSFSPSGTYAYVTNFNANNVVIINTVTNSVIGSITSGFNEPSGVSIFPSGSYAYATNLGSSNVVIINTGADMTNSINSEVMINTGTSVSNPYAGGSTGFFGHLPGATTITSSSTTTATTTAPTTSAVITAPVITASGATAQVCNDTHGYSVNYPSLNSTFYFKPSASSCFNVTASNATSTYISSNSEIIRAINYSFSNSSILSNLTLHYPCNTASSALIPVILKNGTWDEITPFTVNVAACTVTFAAPSDPVVALLNISKSSTTATTTTNVTTTLNTTTAQTTQPAAAIQGNNSSSWEIVAIVVVVIIAIAILVYLWLRTNRKW